MNRTTAYLGLAGALGLLAVAAGLPRAALGLPGRAPPPTTPVEREGSLRLKARLSHPYIAEGQSDVFATMDVEAIQVPGARRSPINVAVVIDRSGSMAGSKLHQAKAAARRLVELTTEADRVCIIHFGSDVRTLGGDRALSKHQLLTAIDGIVDEGGTNISAALDAAESQVAMAAGRFKVNRIILLSDGEPTEGRTSRDDLYGEAQQIRGRGIALSAIGLGTDFNEDLMQALAEAGAGAYAYLRDPSQLSTIFQKDLMAAATTVARDVKLTLQLPDGVRGAEVLGYSADVSGQTVAIPMPDFSSGQMERVVVRLTVDGRQPARAMDISRIRLSYSDLLEQRAGTASAQLSAMVTDRPEEIAAHQDKDATVFAARAQSAANTAQAAESLLKGDKAEARRFLRANEALYKSAAAVAGPAAVAADEEDMDDVVQSFERAATPEAVKHSAKAAKRKARIDSGKIGSTY